MRYFTGKIAINKSYELRKCLECSVHFVVVKRDIKGGLDGSFCGGKCRSKYGNRRRYAEHRNRLARLLIGSLSPCLGCGRHTTLVNGNFGPICSKQCKIKYRDEQQAKRDEDRLALLNKSRIPNGYFRLTPEGLRQRKCRRCDKWMTFQAGERLKCQCAGCSRKQESSRRQKRRLVKDAGDVDPVSVFREAGWKCVACGRRVVLAKIGRDHKVHATIDHIKPIAKGGRHRASNVQCMCRSCNSSKSDSLPENQAADAR